MKKKYLYGALGSLLLILIIIVLKLSDKDGSLSHVSAAAYYGTDASIPDFTEEGIKGTDSNPFVILEIVPYEGYAEIGYMIAGCEPVPLDDDKIIFNNSIGGTLASTQGLSFEWKEEYVDVLPEGGTIGYGPGQWQYSDGRYRRYRNFFSSKHSFLKETLDLTDDQIENYKIHVVTITPDKLNKPANYRLIERADLIYLNPKTHYGSSLIDIWESFYPGKKINSYPQNLYSNDLTWETTVKILEKTIDNEDPAPIVFDVTLFSTDNSYSGSITPKKYFSNGTVVSSLSAQGYTSNTAKLYMVMQLMGPNKFYNEYIATGRVKPIKVKDNAGNPMVKDGINMTTGYFMDLAESSPEYYRKGTADDAAVWNVYTLLPYELFANTAALNGHKGFEAIGYYRLFPFDGDVSHRSVRNGLYSYNGDNSITQIFLQTNISDNYYTDEAFDYYEKKNGGVRPTSLTPAQAIYYLLNMDTPVYDSNTLHILEVEPCNDFVWDGTEEYWDPKKTPAQDSNNGSFYARQYFAKFFPHYSGKIKITTMTSSEFIGRVEDLNSCYDMIYFGLKDGVLRKNGSGTTIYNDSSLNGKVYLHVGDKINAENILRGTLGLTDTVDTYRFSGNDITKLKKNALLSFINAGNPIVFGEGFLTSGGAINTTKIDNGSQIYQLINGNKDRMFFADNINISELESRLSDFKCEFVFGRLDGSLPEKDCYPVIYKDRSKDNSLRDKDIYINGEDINFRTLQYKFFIRDNLTADKTYEISLCIDINADGKFDLMTENLRNLTIMDKYGYSVDYDNLKEGRDYVLTLNLDESFSGVLPWKLEIKDVSNSDYRYSVINYSALKVDEADKVHINVLQIMSNSGNNLNLSNHGLFKTYTENLNDYVLHFNCMTVSEFEDFCGYGAYTYCLEDSSEIRTEDKNASGVYVWDDEDGDNKLDVDMLILGFADVYSDIGNANAIKNIEQYIDQGNTVLFTHDTTSFVNLPEDRYPGSDFWGYHLTKAFRDEFGMDRFGVSKYSTEAARVAAGKDYTNDMYIQGFTDCTLNRFSTSGQYFSHTNFPSGRNTEDEYVTLVNKGQLTMYPYEIDERFKVATTHAQYYQLDMESDEIVVWYCLSDDNTDANGKGNGIYSTTPNDVRNNYYIYNKGNITYSGVGHSAIPNNSSGVMETKLFINTIIAAYSATVKKPVIELTNANRSTDSSGMDFVYVDYDIYETDQSYGSEIVGSGQRVKFKVIDNNVLYNKKITVEYFEINPTDGTETPLSLTTKKVGTNTGVSELIGGTEYFIEVPLGALDTNNRGSTILIRVTLTYGRSSTYQIKSDKKFTLVRRGLFDLE